MGEALDKPGLTLRWRVTESLVPGGLPIWTGEQQLCAILQTRECLMFQRIDADHVKFVYSDWQDVPVEGIPLPG